MYLGIGIFLDPKWFTNLYFPGGSDVKHLPAMWETWVQCLGRIDPPPGENSDPQNRGFIPGPGCSFGMRKVFLNVLASARVCLVKNKVCVH